MTDDGGFEYELDVLALGAGLLGALIASAWALLPSLVYLGPQAGVLTTNRLWLQLGGIAFLILVAVTQAYRTQRSFAPDSTVLTQGGVTLAVGFLLFSQVVAPAAAAATSPTQQDTQQQLAGENLKVVHLNVNGMSCPGCAGSISTYLQKQQGVKAVDITYQQKGGTVVYDSSATSAEEIANSEVFQGYYSAEIKNVKDYSQ